MATKKTQSLVRVKPARVAPLKRQLEACKKRIAAERDKMRSIISEYEDVLCACDQADSDLEHAVDTLSQYL